MYFCFNFFLLFSLLRFRLLESESIEFKRFGLRDNVAQLSVFEVAMNYLLLCNNAISASCNSSSGCFSVFAKLTFQTNLTPLIKKVVNLDNLKAS